MSAATHTLGLGSRLIDGLATVRATLLGVGRGVARRFTNRAAIRQLAAADEFMLRDIGLSRSDVDAALRAPPLTDPIAYVRAFSSERQSSRSRPE
jgi:uncharacterized protein YjiS (DUF1127 family)